MQLDKYLFKPPSSGWMMFWLCLPVLLVYLPYLHNPGVFDDYVLGDPVYLGQFAGFHPLQIRWLPYATMAWTLDISNTKSLGLPLLHLGNLLLHLAVCMALFAFLRHLFEALLPQQEGRLAHSWIAFFGALIFGLHPVTVYGAAYLIQRSGEMAMLFGLLAMTVFLRGLVEERRGLLMLTLPFFYLAGFSKEHLVTLPVVLLMLTILLPGGWEKNLRQSWWVLLGSAIIATILIMVKFSWVATVYEIDGVNMLSPAQRQHPYLLSVPTQMTLFFKYLLLWLIPNNAWMSVDVREPFATSILSMYGLGALAFIFYLAIGAKLLLNKRAQPRLLGFAMLFPAMMFATELVTVRVQEIFVLYRSYLWMPGAMAGLGGLAFHARARFMFMLLLGACLLLVPLAVNRLNTFSSPLLLWDDAAKLVKEREYLKGVDRILYNRANALSDSGLFDEAITGYGRVIELNPDYIHAYYSTGVAYLRKHDYDPALEYFNLTLKKDYRYAKAYMGRALVYQAIGKTDGARLDFMVACGLGYSPACERITKKQ